MTWISVKKASNAHSATLRSTRCRTYASGMRNVAKMVKVVDLHLGLSNTLDAQQQAMLIPRLAVVEGACVQSGTLFLLFPLELPTGKLFILDYLHYVQIAGILLYVVSLFMLFLTNVTQYHQSNILQGIGMVLGVGMLLLSMTSLQSHNWKQHHAFVMGTILAARTPSPALTNYRALTTHVRFTPADCNPQCGLVFGRPLPSRLADSFGKINLICTVSVVSTALLFSLFGIKSEAVVIVFAILYDVFSGAESFPQTRAILPPLGTLFGTPLSASYTASSMFEALPTFLPSALLSPEPGITPRGNREAGDFLMFAFGPVLSALSHPSPRNLRGILDSQTTLGRSAVLLLHIFSNATTGVGGCSHLNCRISLHMRSSDYPRNCAPAAGSRYFYYVKRHSANKITYSPVSNYVARLSIHLRLLARLNNKVMHSRTTPERPNDSLTKNTMQPSHS
ncbi:hypothetical protein POSPLADRAFT_1043323 [Postia placenta MAD-698-R-SB12]|uniref:Uncharacterized protein n=1 Tax=Postia placenta MAD-698-R-SB12 TaxID=670580 RepID=A0A1X6NAY8_9APHY|nr:hypothetical protein POSPLADRAFT_1043323 [Postia placenta MAD-698-R-SB12]OSX65690.1 hypothetical protein POSPLADRAFT_1043323 [Postia placenta MAD-698-R-SB12]